MYMTFSFLYLEPFLEVNTLLERPYEEIDHKKLSAAHLRLLQEARERIVSLWQL